MVACKDMVDVVGQGTGILDVFFYIVQSNLQIKYTITSLPKP